MFDNTSKTRYILHNNIVKTSYNNIVTLISKETFENLVNEKFFFLKILLYIKWLYIFCLYIKFVLNQFINYGNLIHLFISFLIYNSVYSVCLICINHGCSLNKFSSIPPSSSKAEDFQRISLITTHLHNPWKMGQGKISWKNIYVTCLLYISNCNLFICNDYLSVILLIVSVAIFRQTCQIKFLITNS